MKLYYTKGACSLAVRILINELNLPCEYEAVNLKTKETENGHDFLKTNPKGAVPALLLDNGDILTENAVIHQYLADTFPQRGLLPPMSDLNRYHVLEWLNFITTELHKGFGPLFVPTIPDEMKSNIIIPMLKKKFAMISAKLGHSAFLLGDQYMLPDGYLFVMLLWAQHFNIDLNELSNLKNYFQRMNQHESVKRSLQEEKLV